MAEVTIIFADSYRPVVARLLGWRVADPTVHRAGSNNRFWGHDNFPRTDAQALLELYRVVRRTHRRGEGAVRSLALPLLVPDTIFASGAREEVAGILGWQVSSDSGYRTAEGHLRRDRHALRLVYMRLVQMESIDLGHVEQMLDLAYRRREVRR